MVFGRQGWMEACLWKDHLPAFFLLPLCLSCRWAGRFPCFPEDRVQRGKPGVLAGLRGLQENQILHQDCLKSPKDLFWLYTSWCSKGGKEFFSLCALGTEDRDEVESSNPDLKEWQKIQFHLAVPPIFMSIIYQVGNILWNSVKQRRYGLHSPFFTLGMSLPHLLKFLPEVLRKFIFNIICFL